MLDLFAFDSVRDFCVEAISRADYRDLRVGVEEVQDPSGCDLGFLSMSTLLLESSRKVLDIPLRHQ
jgi:hypothetical protein